MNVRSKVLLASFVLVAAMGTVALAWFSPSIFGGKIGEEVCQWIGGKWASARNQCITRACYAAGDCGDWLHPGRWCRDLRTGDAVGEVYFRLGNPAKIDGTTYTWLDGKPDRVAFTAIIENGILKSVNCL